MFEEADVLLGDGVDVLADDAEIVPPLGWRNRYDWSQHQPIDLAASEEDEDSPVVAGILRECEVLNVIAQPKIGKSMLAMDLAIAIATGSNFLGDPRFPATRRPVVIVDNELRPLTLRQRVRAVARAREVAVDELGLLRTFALRGARLSTYDLFKFLTAHAVEPGSVIILDALYRALPTHVDENNNGHMREVYNVLDAITQKMRLSTILVHHSSKGDQSQRAVVDVGAGAGAIGRAADGHLIVRHHEEEHTVVVEGVFRSFGAFTPLCLRFDYPVFNVVDGLDPTDLRTTGRGQRRPSRAARPAQPDLRDFVFRFVPTEPTRREVIVAQAAAAEVSGRAAGQMLARAVDSGFVQRSTETGSRAYLFRRTIV